MSKRRKKAERFANGEKCRKCGRQMQRYRHSAAWTPKENQPYYFSYWDKCACGMLQHYEAAKVWIRDDEPAELDELTNTFKAAMRE